MNSKPEKIIFKGHIRLALSVLGGKWKLEILYYLRQATLRFSELQELMPEVRQKVLTEQLRELEHDGLVTRTVYAEVPPRVEYGATPYAHALLPVLEMLCDWGQEHEKRTEALAAAKEAQESR
ncbi:winged helix-turn-helix transcriptional regulator [Hymenobacter terrenus]|uniref:winged helix-turn-helix transcriptional regulator n=1 Tax=Hymenobacter terrenus TaxID=1629124 RepID=UPI00061941AD|nr:helix-turn-helix domain-containing protein [Hymenobacter terrenus]